MSEVEKASTMSISRFVHSVEAVISDERGNASHEYTATWTWTWSQTYMAPPISSCVGVDGEQEYHARPPRWN